MLTDVASSDTDVVTPIPLRHVYPYTPDMVIRPGMKALCGYEYQGQPYDGTTSDVKADCIVCEDLARVKARK